MVSIALFQPFLPWDDSCNNSTLQFGGFRRLSGSLEEDLAGQSLAGLPRGPAG